MTQHPISPPLELVAAWCREIDDNEPMFPQVAAKAAQWGFDQANADIERERQEAADEELEACCEWLVRDWTDVETADKLRAARRPKPKSEKQQALEQLDGIRTVFRMSHGGELVCDAILRALKSIPDPS